MKKKISVSVGIPAYNEEANIRILLKSLFSQKAKDFVFKKVIVISDGSTDNTVFESRKVKNKKLEIIENKKRAGLNLVENMILKEARSEVLVILNADSLPKDNTFLSKLIKPFYKNKNIGIAAASLKSVPQGNLVGKILAESNELKKKIFENFKAGDNVYLCHGQARAFSRKFYGNFEWPDNVPEDAYSYIVCKQRGFDFFYCKKAVILYSPSKNVVDHAKQSRRFFDGRKILERFFSRGLLNDEYKLPVKALALSLIFFSVRTPHLIIGFAFLMAYIKLFHNIQIIHHSKYEVSESSKRLS